MDLEPVIDRDTQGISGAPDIVATIFSKINGAEAFICDVSFINELKRNANGELTSRPTPNPNVLIELGYALRALGADRVIMVINTAFGDIDLLPFDLRGRRVVAYCIAEGDSNKADVRNRLSDKIAESLRSILSNPIRLPSLTLLFENGQTHVQIEKKWTSPSQGREDKSGLLIRVIRLRLLVCNQGSTPANDIHCEVAYPKTLELLSEKSFKDIYRHYPREDYLPLCSPSPPMSMSEEFEVADSVYRVRENQSEQGVANLQTQFYGDELQPDLTSGKFTISIKKTKQGMAHRVQYLYVKFNNWEDIEPFSMNYRMNADNFQSEGSLAVGITKVKQV